jgi:TDG/mug DNA glycosylase family protein
MNVRPRPTRDEIAAARDGTVADLIGPDLKILFVGINPSLYSAVLGYHFARPGNRFWPTLHAAGFTARQLDPSEGSVLLAAGYGITNVVDRATATADELATSELIEGGRRLDAKVRRTRPRSVALLGITAYRAAFGRPRATLGLQPERVGDAPLWVLPNPSGLNAHYQLADLARLYAEVRLAAEQTSA